MLTIWGRASAPNVQKVLWGLEELGLAYRRIDLGGPFGGGEDPAYRAKNPNGLVPTLQDGDFVLWESHAILRYLAARAGDASLYPPAPRRRAIVDQWLDWQAVHQAQAVRGLVRLLLGAGGAPDPAPEAAAVEAARRAAEPVFAILDQRLAGSPYVAGETFSLADIVCAVGARRWTTLPIERPAFAALNAWLDRVRERPSFALLQVAVAAKGG